MGHSRPSHCGIKPCDVCSCFKSGGPHRSPHPDLSHAVSVCLISLGFLAAAITRRTTISHPILRRPVAIFDAVGSGPSAVSVESPSPLFRWRWCVFRAEVGTGQGGECNAPRGQRASTATVAAPCRSNRASGDPWTISRQWGGPARCDPHHRAFGERRMRRTAIAGAANN